MFRKLFGSASPEDRFWRWFLENSQGLLTSKDYEGPLFQELGRRLEAVEVGLVWEIAVREREFVISADGIRQLFPVVERLVAAAPTMPGWRIVAFRQRGPVDWVFEKDGFRLSAENMRFRMRSGQGGRVNLELYIEGYKHENKVLAEGAFILLDVAVGEYDMETKVGAIDFYPTEEAGVATDLLPFKEFPRVLDDWFKR